MKIHQRTLQAAGFGIVFFSAAMAATAGVAAPDAPAAPAPVGIPVFGDARTGEAWLPIESGPESRILLEFMVDDFEYNDSALNHGWSISRGTGTANTEARGDAKGGRVVRLATSANPSTDFGIQKSVPFVALPWLVFEVRSTTNFAVVAVIETTDQRTYSLIYHARNGEPFVGFNSNQLWFPLGTGLLDGNWHRVARQIRRDLRLLVPDATYGFTKEVRIYGAPRIDDVKLSN